MAAQPLRGWARILGTVGCICTWYSASVSSECRVACACVPPRADIARYVRCYYCALAAVIFANKHLLTARNFHFPFAMTFVNNFFVSVIAYLLTRHPRLRQPKLPWVTIKWVVIPIGSEAQQLPRL